MTGHGIPVHVLLDEAGAFDVTLPVPPQHFPVAGWWMSDADVVGDMLEERYGLPLVRAESLLRDVMAARTGARDALDWSHLARLIDPPAAVRQRPRIRRMSRAEQAFAALIHGRDARPDPTEYCLHPFEPSGCPCMVQIGDHAEHRCGHGHRWVCV